MFCDQPPDRIVNALLSQPDIAYILCQLVFLQLDKSFVESFCRVLFPLDKILFILAQKDLKLDAFLVYSKLLHEVYIKTERKLHTEVEDLLDQK